MRNSKKMNRLQRLSVWTFRALLFVSAAWGSCGCASAEPVSNSTLTPACDVVISPVDALSLQAQTAADRWSRVTGCNIRVGSGGTVVRLGHPTDAVTGASLLGGTHFDPLEIVINDNIGGETLQFSVTHEMGHSLAGHPGHVDTGLMQVNAPKNSKIDGASLELICNTLDCAVFSPEN